jgi:nucleotide-binding universal stress UspA family protein
MPQLCDCSQSLSEQEEIVMTCVLIPVDGSDNSTRAVDAACRQLAIWAAGDGASAERSAADHSAIVKNHLSQDFIDKCYQELGETALGTRRARLHEAGIACTSHVEVGDVAQTIARYVRDLYCNQVIMGTRGLGSGVHRGHLRTADGLDRDESAASCRGAGDIREVTSFGLLGGSLRMAMNQRRDRAFGLSVAPAAERHYGNDCFMHRPPTRVDRFRATAVAVPIVPLRRGQGRLRSIAPVRPAPATACYPSEADAAAERPETADGRTGR